MKPLDVRSTKTKNKSKNPKVQFGTFWTQIEQTSHCEEKVLIQNHCKIFINFTYLGEGEPEVGGGQKYLKFFVWNI